MMTPGLFNLHIHSHMTDFSASIRVRTTASFSSQYGKAAGDKIVVNVVSCDQKHFVTDLECAFNRGDPIIFQSKTQSELFGGIQPLNRSGEPNVYWVVDISADKKKFSISDSEPSFVSESTSDSGVCLPFRSCFPQRRPVINETKVSLVRFASIDESSGKEADGGVEWMKLNTTPDGRSFGMTVEPREYYVSQARNEAKAKSHLEQEIDFQSCPLLDMFADYLIKAGHHANNPLLLICCDSEKVHEVSRILKEPRVLRFTRLSTDDESFLEAKQFFASRESHWDVGSILPDCVQCARAKSKLAHSARFCSDDEEGKVLAELASRATKLANEHAAAAKVSPNDAEAVRAAQDSRKVADLAVQRRDAACDRAYAVAAPPQDPSSAITCLHKEHEKENNATVAYFIFNSALAASTAKTEIESSLATYLKRERPCVSAHVHAILKHQSRSIGSHFPSLYSFAVPNRTCFRLEPVRPTHRVVLAASICRA